jgi:hypothetical protein
MSHIDAHSHLLGTTISEHRHNVWRAARRLKVARALGMIRSGDSVRKACRVAGLRGQGAQGEVLRICARLGLPRRKWETSEPFPGYVPSRK